MKTDPALETPARTKGPLQAWLHIPPSPHPEGRHLEELSAQRKGLIVSVPWTVAPGPKATQDERYLLWALARRHKFNGGTVGKEGTVRVPVVDPSSHPTSAPSCATWSKSAAPCLGLLGSRWDHGGPTSASLYTACVGHEGELRKWQRSQDRQHGCGMWERHLGATPPLADGPKCPAHGGHPCVCSGNESLF